MAPHNDIVAFHKVLKKSERILALCGAGLSASSGLPTFRGAGGYWRNYDATRLATPEAFSQDPHLVWLFYAYRRHMALQAAPNAGHYALAELARKKPQFLCLTQNVDGLSSRAGHPPGQLRTLHGSLFDIKCDQHNCDYLENDNHDDPLCEVLAPAAMHVPEGQLHPLLDNSKPLARVDRGQLPHCPECHRGLLRPAVVWFGEYLDDNLLEEIDDWIDAGKVDLMLVVGTSAVVWPAAGYVNKAKTAGATVCTVNWDAEDSTEQRRIRPGDFAFNRDAADALPALLEPVVGTWDGGKFDS